MYYIISIAATMHVCPNYECYVHCTCMCACVHVNVCTQDDIHSELWPMHVCPNYECYVHCTCMCACVHVNVCTQDDIHSELCLEGGAIPMACL